MLSHSIYLVLALCYLSTNPYKVCAISDELSEDWTLFKHSVYSRIRQSNLTHSSDSQIYSVSDELSEDTCFTNDMLVGSHVPVGMTSASVGVNSASVRAHPVPPPLPMEVPPPPSDLEHLYSFRYVTTQY